MLVKVVSSMFEYKNTSLFLEKMPPSVELGSSPNLDFKLPPFRVLSRTRKCCDNQDFLILDLTCSTILDAVPGVSILMSYGLTKCARRTKTDCKDRAFTA